MPACLRACTCFKHVNVRAVIFENVFSFVYTSRLKPGRQREKKLNFFDVWCGGGGGGVSVCREMTMMMMMMCGDNLQLQSNLSPRCPFLLGRRFPFAFVALHCTQSLLGVNTHTKKKTASSLERLENWAQIWSVSPYLLCVNRIHREVLLHIWCIWSHDAGCSIVGCFMGAIRGGWLVLVGRLVGGGERELKCEVILYSSSFYILLSSRAAAC